jgi:peptidyl-prolyl cis-trans isomerase-like 4
MRAAHNAEILEMYGDLPDSGARPSELTLFVCKLNPITSEEGLTIFFSRFGEVKKVDLIRDKETMRSLCYAFVEFDSARHAENAFLKAQKTVLDGRTIRVDFSQSVKR